MELEMLDHGAALVVCRYSDEAFNTGDVIVPDWRAIPNHLPSLLTFALLALAPLAGGAAIWWRRGAPVSLKSSLLARFR